MSVGSLPSVISPVETSAHTPAEISVWVQHNETAVKARLRIKGALLFRGFGFKEFSEFEHFTALFADTLNTYVGGASRRTNVEGKVFTSTDTAAHFTINQHHEGAYLPQMPRTIGFYCRIAATKGGQTPLADGRKVLARLPAELVARYESRGVRYVNNLPNGFGVGKSWQAQFQTPDRDAVEKILGEEAYEFTWKPDGGLRTALRAGAVGVHPVTGERAWVTQVDHWHPTGLEPAMRARLAKALPPEDFPMNATYGDGGALPDEDFVVIRAAINAETVEFDWQAGDVLICDNYLVSHGRRPFEGERKVFVALG